MAAGAGQSGLILIHGGGLESWAWRRVLPLLQHPTVATHRIPPGRYWKTLSVLDCARYLQRQAAEAGLQRYLIVAHSIGGVLARELALLAPQQVAGIVLLAANVPAPGKSALSSLPFGQRLELTAGQLLARWEITPVKALKHWIGETLCHDLDAVATQEMLEKSVVTEPPSLFFSRADARPWPRLPTTYVRLRQDRALAPALQTRLAASIGASLEEIDCGHTVMLARPQALAELLNRIASEHLGPPPAP